jgi:hypothetical protein
MPISLEGIPPQLYAGHAITFSVTFKPPPSPYHSLSGKLKIMEHTTGQPSRILYEDTYYMYEYEQWTRFFAYNPPITKLGEQKGISAEMLWIQPKIPEYTKKTFQVSYLPSPRVRPTPLGRPSDDWQKWVEDSRKNFEETVTNTAAIIVACLVGTVVVVGAGAYVWYTKVKVE